MTIALAVMVLALSVLVFLMLGAMVELFRDIEQIREHGQLVDRPLPIDLKNAAGQRPSALGLPPDLDEAPWWVVLFLSDRCSSCRAIAQSLRGGVPHGLTVVLSHGPTAEENDYMHGLEEYAEAVVVDPDGHLASRANLNITPAALVVRDGAVVGARTVPSTRQLTILMEEASRSGAQRLTRTLIDVEEVT